LLIAAGALSAFSTATDKWQGYPVTFAKSLDTGAHSFDDTRNLVPRHMRQRNVRIVTHPAMPVAAADAGCADPEHDAGIARLRIIDAADFDRALEFLV
jgi:hypothetical protein